MWLRILTIIKKELIIVLRDPRTRFTLLVPPLIQLFVFTFAATLDVKNVPIGIYNQDNGEKSFELVQRFRGAPAFNHIVHLQGHSEIAPFLDRQKGAMVICFDEQFSRNLDAKKEADVLLILDGRKSNSTQIIAGYATQIINKFNDDYMAYARIKEQNTDLFPRYWFNPNLLYYWYNIPSLVTTLSMITCLVVTSISVAREREMGTFDQLLVSPLIPVEILFGKLIPGIIVGLSEGLMLAAIGVFVFQVPFTGSFLLFLMSLIVFITAIGGVGLFISSLAATQQQAMLGTFVVMVPSVLLSGFATPIENMPSWLQPFTFVIALRYMLVISKGIFLKELPLIAVLKNLWPLAIIAVATLMSAGVLFRRRLE